MKEIEFDFDYYGLQLFVSVYCEAYNDYTINKVEAYNGQKTYTFDWEDALGNDFYEKVMEKAREEKNYV